MEHKLSMLLIFMISVCYQTVAQGNLLITPKRVVFEGNKQKTEINLINTGTDTATYSISFRHYNMNMKGKLVLIEKEDSLQMFADPYLRIFPREVTLAPGEAQIVMLQFRRKVDMKSGEYRSHLWFRSEGNYNALVKEKPKLDTTQLSVSVVAIFGITIPVIIRTGDLNVYTKLTDLKLENQNDSVARLNLTINREGNCSSYGDVIVEYASTQVKPIQVGKIKSVGVYTNIESRDVFISLNKLSGIDFKTGNLRVRYTSPDDTKYMVYAEAVLPLTEQPSIAQGASGEQGKNQKKEQ